MHTFAASGAKLEDCPRPIPIIIMAKNTLIIFANPTKAFTWFSHWSNGSVFVAVWININSVAFFLIYYCSIKYGILSILTLCALFNNGRFWSPPFAAVHKSAAIPESKGVDCKHAKLRSAKSNTTHVSFSHTQAGRLFQSLRVHGQ